ncbi:2-oxoacid:ferredoxin oxidoreductase subunit beta [Candidatus Gracilibacteria bacterium]|nr:2-oxoacid:ferredoxin oxidoreductase subunit beta [Candidatus Gracilibacteria bacterium]
MDAKKIEQLTKKADQIGKLDTKQVMTWCDGCGNYGIQNALKRAIVLENIEQQKLLQCFDIGCVGNESDKVECYTIHGLHGRVLPLAVGAKIANPELTVIASAGDGGTFSEGVNHLVHAVRNDYPILFLLHDNENYALTTGQATATTPKGQVRNGTPDGVAQDPLNPLQFVLSLGPSFVAQTLSANVNHMTEVFQKALRHKGFAFVEILQTCPTYNKQCPNEWYAERVFEVEKLKNYDCRDIWQARKIVAETGKFPIGVIYENLQKKNFLETVPHREKRKTTLIEEVAHTDITKFLGKL